MGTIAGIRSRVQRALFVVEEALPPLTEQQKLVVMVLEVVRVEQVIPARGWCWLGRRPRDRQALAELPTACDVGTKTNSKGHNHHWVGYKFHVAVGDGGVPLAAVTTSASVHDSQVAIPLMKTTAQRVDSWYALMDSAYDSGPHQAGGTGVGARAHY